MKTRTTLGFSWAAAIPDSEISVARTLNGIVFDFTYYPRAE
jgi:hypothetical protein